MISSLVLKDIRKRYHLAGFRLSIDNLEFHNRYIHVIVGANGSGKSTILKLISFLDRPDTGRILFNERELFPNRNGYAKLCKKIGFVMQNPYLFNMNVWGNIALGLKIRKYPKKEIVSKVREILATLKIEHLAERRVRDLSRGEYQKVAIAQVLILCPEIILMDEPAANIDAESTLSIEETIKDIQKRFNSIVIITTHSQNQAHRISPDVITIKEGEIVR